MRKLVTILGMLLIVLTATAQTSVTCEDILAEKQSSLEWMMQNAPYGQSHRNASWKLVKKCTDVEKYTEFQVQSECEKWSRGSSSIGDMIGYCSKAKNKFTVQIAKTKNPYSVCVLEHKYEKQNQANQNWESFTEVQLVNAFTGGNNIIAMFDRLVEYDMSKSLVLNFKNAFVASSTKQDTKNQDRVDKYLIFGNDELTYRHSIASKKKNYLVDQLTSLNCQ